MPLAKTRRQPQPTAQEAPPAEDKTQRRSLGLGAAVALVVGEVIGVGIFLTPAEMIHALGSPFWVFIVWLVVGTTALCGALCYGELASRYPHAGGGYVYLREIWGPGIAFLYGWKSLLVMDPGLTAALAAGFGRTLAGLVPLSDGEQKAVAVAAILILAVIGALGARLGSGTVVFLTAIKVLLLGTIVLRGFVPGRGSWSNFHPLVAQRPGASPLIAGLAGGLIGAFFSYGGFWDVAKIAGETRDPARTLPRALLLGVCIVTIVYILTSAAFIHLVPIEAAGSGPGFAAQAGTALFGHNGGLAFTAIVLIAIASSLAAVQFTAPRVYFAMARDGSFPAAVGRLHPRFGTPVRAIALQAVLASVVVALATFDAILAWFVFVTVAFIALTVAGIYRLERNEGGALRLPGYPFTPAAFLALLVTLLVLLGAGRPLEAGLGMGMVALGYPIYRFLVLPRKRHVRGES